MVVVIAFAEGFHLGIVFVIADFDVKLTADVVIAEPSGADGIQIRALAHVIHLLSRELYVRKELAYRLGGRSKVVAPE